MSKIKRLEPNWDERVQGMESNPYGDYVLYDDHAAEIERITKLAEGLAKAASFLVENPYEVSWQGSAVVNHTAEKDVHAALKAWRERDK